MSGANFFAALDDSGDEENIVVKQEKPKKSNKPVVEPSKVDRGRRPNQNDRNTKYGRGGRAPARDGKRAYDRRSGTGRGREIKKEGGGARNWGSNKNDARAAEGQVQEGAEEELAMGENNEGANKEDENENGKTQENEEEVAAPPEEEDKTMTYEEYMATKDAPPNDAFAPVKHREVKNEFAGIEAKKVEKDEVFFSTGGGKQKRSKQKKGHKQTLVPAFRVADDRRRDGRGRGRGRGDRGGRGGRGERGGRGGGRGRGRGRESGEINVLDEAAFPSLG